MEGLKTTCSRYPISMFLLIAFGYTWAVWFGSMLFQDDWAIRKIVTGMGFGPAIAAILLGVFSGKQCIANSKKWWSWFFASFLVLLASYLSILMTGDGITASDFSRTKPPGFSAANVTLCLVSATIGAFIIAATFGAQTPVYNGYVSFKKAGKWLLIATLLPSAWLLTGWLLANFQNKEIGDVLGGIEGLVWFAYIVRSILFTLLVVAVGEELGWRGWLLPALQEKFSPLLSATLLGIVWGLWHFPLYFTGAYGEPPQMVFAKVGVCVFLSILFTFLHNRSYGNLMVAILLHTSLNNTQRIIPVTEEMGILMMLTILVLPFIDKMWRNPSKF